MNLDEVLEQVTRVCNSACNDPFDESRHDCMRNPPPVLRRGANAVGWAALASLLGGEACSAAAGAGSTGDRRRPARTSRPRPSTSSTCTWSAGRRRWTCTTTSRKMKEWYDKDLPDSDPQGPAADHDDLAARRASRSRRRSSSSRSTASSGMWMSRAAAVHGEDGRRHRASSAVMHTEAINHEPAITLHADRQPGHRPAVPRRLGLATASAR